MTIDLDRWVVFDRETGKVVGVGGDENVPALFSSKAGAQGYAGHTDRRFGKENRRRFEVCRARVTVAVESEGLNA